MPKQNDLPWAHDNQCCADVCSHCGEVIRHEPWCITQNARVHYAYQVVSDPCHMTRRDRLILYALGVAWTARRTSPRVR